MIAIRLLSQKGLQFHIEALSNGSRLLPDTKLAKNIIQLILRRHLAGYLT